MDSHPLCRILPDMSDAEFRMLVDDVRAKGLLHPITRFEGMILDGRHRFRACTEAGVTPRFEEYVGDDPIGFVQSSCIYRSLNPTQRALVGQGFLEYERDRARKRMSAGGGDQKSGLTNWSDPITEPGRAVDKAAARAGSSGTQIARADHVMKRAIPEIIDKCKAGEMTLNEATRIADLNPNAQKKIAAMPKVQRANEIHIAHNRKNACAARDNKKQMPEQPGTPFVRAFLSNIERLSMYCAEHSLKSGSEIATAFMADMDWSSDPLAIQFERCEPIIRALAIIQQSRASKAA